jgi:hypothetical protein
LAGILEKYLLKVSEFLSENGSKVNFLLFAAFLTFLIIGIDLDSDIAVQKDEIDSVVATLINSINTLNLDATEVLTIEPPLLGVLSSFDIKPHTNEVSDFPTGRSPPLT